MTAQTRTAMKALLETGDVITQTTTIDLVDSAVSISDDLAYAEITVENNASGTAPPGTSTDFSQKRQITTWDANGQSYNATPDYTESHIQIDDTGIYLVSCNISFAGGANEIYSFAIFKNNGATKVTPRFTRKLNSAGDVGAASLSSIVSLTAADTIELWYQDENGTSAVAIQDGCLSVVRLK